MTLKRRQSKPKKTNSMTSAPTRAQRFAFFGPPPVLEGEDAALYDELVGRMWAAVQPVDIIDELFVADLVYLAWEILRWRRLKFGLLQASLHDALQWFLKERLDYEAYAEDFAAALAAILAEILEEARQKDLAEEAAEILAEARQEDLAEEILEESGQEDLAEEAAEISEESLREYLAEEASELAHQYVRSEPDAVERVRQLLEADGRDADRMLDQILQQAKDQRAEALGRAYVRREPEAVQLVNEFLESSGRTMHDLTVEALPQNLDEIERIDRLLTIAETRRNISLREIDRRCSAKRCGGTCKTLRTLNSRKSRRYPRNDNARCRLAANRRRRRSARPEVDPGGPHVIEVNQKGAIRRDEPAQDQGQPRQRTGQHRPEHRAGPRPHGAQWAAPRLERAGCFGSGFFRSGRRARARHCRARRRRRTPRTGAPGGRSGDRSAPRASRAPSPPEPCMARP